MIDLCCEVLGNGALSDQFSELSKMTVLKLRASAWVAGSLRLFLRGSDIRVPGCQGALPGIELAIDTAMQLYSELGFTEKPFPDHAE
ncbi:MAG: hypothetical protein VYA08_04525 [Pseudomonadota bacterium]|nr:hypothetical protein [Pseudomonadota bacterium]